MIRTMAVYLVLTYFMVRIGVYKYSYVGKSTPITTLACTVMRKQIAKEIMRERATGQAQWEDKNLTQRQTGPNEAQKDRQWWMLSGRPTHALHIMATGW